MLSLFSLILLAFLGCAPQQAEVSESNTAALEVRVAALEAELATLQDEQASTAAAVEAQGLAGAELEAGLGQVGADLAALDEVVGDLTDELAALQDQVDGLGGEPQIWSLSESYPPGGFTDDWSDIPTTGLDLELEHLGPVFVVCSGLISDYSKSSYYYGTRLMFSDADMEQTSADYTPEGGSIIHRLAMGLFTPTTHDVAVTCQSLGIAFSLIEVYAMQFPA